MKKTFSYDFEDESEKSRISFEYDEETEEKLLVKVESAYLFYMGISRLFCY